MTDEASAMTDFTYEVRKSVLGPCLSWRLAAGSLICEVQAENAEPGGMRGLLGQWPREVPYDQITSIRLSFDPTRVDSRRYRCVLRGPGEVRASIVSTSYAGFASFEDRGERYAPFIRELVRRVQTARPTVKVATGLSWPAYILQHGFLLGAIIALVSVLGVTGVPAFGPVYVKLAIVVLYGGTLARYARVNRPRDLTLPPQD